MASKVLSFGGNTKASDASNLRPAIKPSIENKVAIQVWHVASFALLFLGVVSKLLFPEPIILPVVHSDARVFAVLVEAVLAIWLFFGRSTLSLRTATGLCFLGFAAFASWSWYGGAETCACFGSAAQVPPWLMVVVDLGITALTLRFSTLAVHFSCDWSHSCTIGARRLVLGASLVVATGSLIHGSPSEFADRLLGKVISTTRPYAAIGAVPLSSTREVRFDLKNLTAAPIQIVGVRKSCVCVVLGELPVALAPHSSTPFPVRLKTDSFRSSGLVDADVELFLDTPSFPIRLRISAFVDATRTQSDNVVASTGGK